MPEVAQATILVTPVLEGAQQSLTEQLTGAAEPAASSAGKAAGKSLGEGMSSVGGALTKGVTAPIMGIGAAAVAAWKDVDEGLDTIVQKTGASGEAMDEMHGILNNITSSIPTDFATAGAAIGEVNTRFGVTGQELEDLSAQFLKFAQLNNTDVSGSIDSVQAAMAAYGMDVSDASDVLDILNKVGQDTGVSMDTLASSLLANNAVLQDAGLGFNESANFLGNLGKNGIDTSSVMSGLKRAMANAAAEGKTTGEALAEIQEQLIGAETGAEAAQIAMELFGSRSGAQIAQMVRDGRLSFDEFSGMVTDWGDSVSTTFDNTLDPIDNMTTTMNQLESAGAELVDAAGPMLVQIFSGLADVVTQVSDAWGNLSPEMQETIIQVAGIAAAVGPLLAIGGKLLGGLGSISGLITPLVTNLGGLSTAATSAAAPVATAGASFGTMAGQALKLVAVGASIVLVAVGIGLLADAAIRVSSAGTAAIATLAGMAVGIGALMAVASAVGPGLTAGAVGIGVFGAAILAIGGGIDLACTGITKVIDAVTNFTTVITSNSDSVNSIVSNMGTTVSGVLETIADGFTRVIDSISGGISSVLDSVAGIIDSIGNAALNAGTGFDTLANAVLKLVDAGIISLGSTLGTVADGITKIASAASSAGGSASSITNLTNAFNPLKSAASTAQSAFMTFSNSVKSAMMNMSSSVASSVNSARGQMTSLQSSAIGMASSIRGSIDGMGLGSAMANQMASAYSSASGYISALRSLFASTTFSFNQSIALPHFSMSGTFNAQSGTVPSVSVSWYKKAAEYGALFSTPTIIGVGDSADPELLLGENKLRELLGDGRGVTYNVTVNGAENPETWAARFVRETKQLMRIS